jgi:hypothetical protein
VRPHLASAAVLSAVLVIILAPPALGHEGEESVPAFTDVQEGIAILAGHPGSFPEAEVMDHAMDKVHDALESEDKHGVDLPLLKQASGALDRNDMSGALVLLERSIGACPGAPVLEPKEPPRSPQPLSSPCPNPQHFQGVSSSAVGGTQEAVFLILAMGMVVAGLLLVRRIR